MSRKLLLLLAASAEGWSSNLCSVQVFATDEDVTVVEASVSLVMSETRLAVKLPRYEPRA